jgi:hypothetical protein
MIKRFLIAVLAIATAAPAVAGAGNFTLVNKAGGALSELSIRRHGTPNWTPLPNAASPDASTAIVFSDPDCAFDLRATVAGAGQVVWSGVNLCEVSRVTLRRAPSGTAFAEYD